MTTLEYTISILESLPETDLIIIQALAKKLFQCHEDRVNTAKSLFVILPQDASLEDAKGRNNQIIGLLICKDTDDVVAKYALEDISQPIGIAAYELAKVLREEFKSRLPTVEEIESELSEKIGLQFVSQFSKEIIILFLMSL